jgi:hypothetical protein
MTTVTISEPYQRFGYGSSGASDTVEVSPGEGDASVLNRGEETSIVSDA